MSWYASVILSYTKNRKASALSFYQMFSAQKYQVPNLISGSFLFIHSSQPDDVGFKFAWRKVMFSMGKVNGFLDLISGLSRYGT